ncbi:MAG: FAD-dependent oxidoreductase, partial [Bacteroidota bacterium]
MIPDVIVLGGGLSGLSAAVDACVRGFRVVLLERRRFAGGRTYSFVDELTGDVVDNGQHLLMGCYHATRKYLRLIGSDHLAELQRSEANPHQLLDRDPAPAFRSLGH